MMAKTSAGEDLQADLEMAERPERRCGRSSGVPDLEDHQEAREGERQRLAERDHLVVASAGAAVTEAAPKASAGTP